MLASGDLPPVLEIAPHVLEWQPLSATAVQCDRHSLLLSLAPSFFVYVHLCVHTYIHTYVVCMYTEYCSVASASSTMDATQSPTTGAPEQLNVIEGYEHRSPPIHVHIIH